MAKAFIVNNESEYYTLEEISKVLLMDSTHVLEMINDASLWDQEELSQLNDSIKVNGVLFYPSKIISSLDKLIMKNYGGLYKKNYQEQITEINIALFGYDEEE